jgi:hypothetical protein
LGYDYANVKNILDNEYASIPVRYADWISWRSEEIKTTLEAAHLQLKRSAAQVRAATLLSTIRPKTTIMSHILESVSRSETRSEVQQISRTQELRGQSWAILGIIGDASYEKKKIAIMNEIGRRYFKEMHMVMMQQDNHDEIKDLDPNLIENEDLIEHAFYKQNLTLPLAFLTWIESQKAEIDNLIMEPMIAIFEASEDADSLVKKSEAMCQNNDLKHVSIAVVRMYSWLKMDSLENSKISRSSRDPLSASFFKAMQNASVTPETVETAAFEPSITEKTLAESAKNACDDCSN